MGSQRIVSTVGRRESRFLFFFLNDPAPPKLSPLPLHAALPILGLARLPESCLPPAQQTARDPRPFGFCLVSDYLGLTRLLPVVGWGRDSRKRGRSRRGAGPG